MGTSSCELLGGIFSMVVQGFLALAAVGSLVLKRHLEKPQRPVKIFVLDMSKQLVGGFFIHFANMGVSAVLESETDSDSDQCAFYFINFFIDCSAGVLVVYVAHEAICSLGKRCYGQRSALAHIGDYGEPPNLNYCVWATQLCAWLLALLINKLLVASLLYATRTAMASFGNWLFGPLQPYPNVELTVVMVLCPWLLETLQFWIFDHFLKAKARDPGSRYEKLSDSTEPHHSSGSLQYKGDSRASSGTMEGNQVL